MACEFAGFLETYLAETVVGWTVQRDADDGAPVVAAARGASPCG